MKTIRKFDELVKPAKVSVMAKIMGGGRETSSKTWVETCGDTCQRVTQTDAYEDCNGNGTWDNNETGVESVNVQTVECP